MNPAPTRLSRRALLAAGATGLDLIHQIQRHRARQQYYIHAPSSTYIAVWDPALKGYAPSPGYDYGGAARDGVAGAVSGGRSPMGAGR